MKLSIRRHNARSSWLVAIATALLLVGSGCQVTRKPDAGVLLSGIKSSKPVSEHDSDAGQVALVSTQSASSSENSGFNSEPDRDQLADSGRAALSQSATVRGQSVVVPAPGDGSGQLPPPNRYQTPQSSVPSYPSLEASASDATPPGGGSGYSSAPGASPYGSPYGSEYGSQLAPGVSQYSGGAEATLAPGVLPPVDPYADLGGVDGPALGPRERIAPIDVYVQEARTGRIILGGAVNSDLGVSGQLIIDERNFDISRLPRSWSDLWGGRAFRGAGQNFRAEIMPGSQVQRYTVSLTEPHVFNLPYSLSVGGFLYSRQYRDWTEQRLGGRVAVGYEVTKDLAVSSELRMEDVKLFDPRIGGVDSLDSALGSNDVYRGRFRLTHDTRDSRMMASEGGLFEIIYDQVFGEYDYSQAQINLSRYNLIRERADGGGRHVLANTWKLGFTGAQTPIFDKFYAGGYSTLRGFSFRGASPKESDVQVGGDFMFLGSMEYIFPLTADEMLRGVAFLDYGTVEENIEFNSENFRIAPGFGFRVAVAALGPAPLAFDFAFPINYADTDDRQVFAFFMGYTRSP